MSDTSRTSRNNPAVEAESEALCRNRQRPGGKPTLLGLAFSGGGIRSATFNLGIVQSLVRQGLLGKVDYLSTVSGGGYVGSWLSALIKRCGGQIGEAEVSDSIGFLRRYSNYLTPRFGLFSLDTLAAVACLVRNLLLNQTVLVTFFLTLLALPVLLRQGSPGYLWASPEASMAGFAVFMGVAALVMAYGLITLSAPAGATSLSGRLARAAGGCALVAAYLLAGLIWARNQGSTPSGPLGAASSLALAAGTTYVVAWLVGWFIARRLAGRAADQSWANTDLDPQRNDHRSDQILWFFVATGAAAICLSVLVMAYGAMGRKLGVLADSDFTLVFGPPALLTTLCLATVVHIGLGKRLFLESMREWLARAGGFCIALGLGWLVFFAMAIYGPALLRGLKSWAVEGGLAWAATTVGGIWLARSDKTGGAKSNRWLEVVALAAPYVFVGGLLLGLAGLAHWSVKAVVLGPEPVVAEATYPCGAAPVQCPPSFAGEFSREMGQVDEERDQINRDAPIANACLLVAALALCGFFSWRVDINLFSMHQFYRNRLTRCYLGASNRERRPNRFTDFDFADDVRLSDLAGQRPIHLVNCALNLTKVAQLQWQQRQSASFVFTPYQCGFQLLANDPASAWFAPTPRYLQTNGPWLAMAAAASGAAANPNQGYHTAPALAFCMAFLNVRLGRWVPNPALPKVWDKASPGNSLKYLLKELLADSDECSRFLNLSDGGHFENLGLYELVRRQCRLIVVCDGGCDPVPWHFEDLGNAVRKCRLDFGVDITIDLAPLGEEGKGRRRFAVGRIDYGPGVPKGVLVYIKPMVLGDEPTDIFHYQATHPAFPHQSTADQWFDEPQFESYRLLGELTGESVFASHPWHPAGQDDGGQDAWVEAVAKELENDYLSQLNGSPS